MRLALLLLLTAAFGAPRASAQAADTSRGASRAARFTLSGWDRRVRLAVWDRSHAAGGRFTDRGVLQRWTPEMDDEYDLDLFATLPTPADDAAFYAAPNGVRTSAGSIRTDRFVSETEARLAVPVAPGVGLGVRLVQQEDLSARRAAVELAYSAGLGRGHRLGLRHSIGETKTDLDVELVYSYAAPSGARAEAALGRLDGLNNLVDAVLVPSPFDTDTVRVYRETPYWSRVRGSLPLGRVRVEAVGGITPWSRVDARSQSGEGAAFVYESRFTYAGVLAETDLSPRVAVGGEVRGLRSNAERRAVASADGFAAWQTELRASVFALGRWRAVRGEALLAREHRSDRQSGTAFAGSTIGGPYSVRERWTYLRLRADWQPGARGVTLGAELLGALRAFADEADREALQREMSPVFPYGPNWRLLARAGYRVSPRADVVLAFGADLDGDRYFPGQDRRYDGGHIRLRAVW